MDWNKIITDIGIIGIISGLLVWLIKQLGQLFINRNLSLYKQELQNKSDLHKSELNQVFEKPRTTPSLSTFLTLGLGNRRLLPAKFLH